MIEHQFTATIRDILVQEFGDSASSVFSSSLLVQYLNIKTKSASRGAKSRSAFANHYALFVLLEDYVKKDYQRRTDYHLYEGARFADLLTRQRELPFGSKLQNHALNHRLNEEFRKYFPTSEYLPILRNAETNRYWINQNLLLIEINGLEINLAAALIKIINAYIQAKLSAFENFMHDLQEIQQIEKAQDEKVIGFIQSLLRPNVDARIFEIVSYAILKEFYSGQFIYWGWSLSAIQQETLKLYKTGRTNANDGGVDFVMKPLGRFFQVTETLDVRKYFLDIDKIQRFPITFVIKSDESPENIKSHIEQQAYRIYQVVEIVDRYMAAIEEIINIPLLTEKLIALANEGKMSAVVNEIVLQSKLEFNYEEI